MSKRFQFGVGRKRGVLGYAMRRRTGRRSDPAESRMRVSDIRGRSVEEVKAGSRIEGRYERLFGWKVCMNSHGGDKRIAVLVSLVNQG